MNRLPEGLTDSLEDVRVSEEDQRYYMPVQEGDESKDVLAF